MKFEASEDVHCGPIWAGSDTSSKNINLNGLTLFIVRNVSKNVASWGNWVIASPATTIASSENTGDVMVEKTFMILAMCPSDKIKPGTQDVTCRHWRALSSDRSRSIAHLQLKPTCEPTQNHLPTGRSTILNRSVSRVSAHASKRIGAQLSLPRRSM